jgi:hypothetical protein
VADFFTSQLPTANTTQQDPHGPDDPFRTINYPHLDISGHGGMDEQDIGNRGYIGQPPLYLLEKVSFRFTPTTDTKQFEVPSDLDCGLG